MNYNVKYTNFDEMGDEIVDDLIRAFESREQLKDSIAKAIDEYVASALRDWTKRFSPGVEIKDGAIVVHLLGGIEHKQDGSSSMYDYGEELSATYDLTGELLRWPEFWEFENAEQADSLAVSLEALATQLRKEAQDIRDDVRD